MKNKKIDILKRQIVEENKKNSTINTALCYTLISLSVSEHDNDGIAFGHLWLADAFLYAEDKIACMHEIQTARKYIDEHTLNELLEKYYSMEYRFYMSLYDMSTAFEYCLKALQISEYLYEHPVVGDGYHCCFIHTVENRIAGNYGNIGINFFNHGLYENALLYCGKAIRILEKIDSVNVYAECLLRLNMVISSIRIHKDYAFLAEIDKISALPMDANILKIFVDYGYVYYYLYIKKDEKLFYYIHELLNDQIEIHTDRLTAIDFFIEVLDLIIEAKHKDLAQSLFDALEDLIPSDHAAPLLKLVDLKIMYAKTFMEEEKLCTYYKEYYTLYLENEKQIIDFKINGLETRLILNKIEIENTQSKDELENLEKIVNYDELTKLYNRRYLSIKYEELMNEQMKRNIGFVIVDIDYFKEYNDTYGHLAGDDVLKMVAECLQTTLQEKMIACRYGGDEFMVVSWDQDIAYLNKYVQTIQAALAALQIEHIKSLCAKQVTLSIGFGNREVRTQSDILLLFKDVDEALYIAKENGRNQAYALS